MPARHSELLGDWRRGVDDRQGRFLEHLRPQWRRLHLVARQYAGSQQDAWDLAQETLLRAWRNFNPSDERTYSRAWLFVIMRNVAFEWKRTARRRIRLVPLPEAELTDAAPFDPAEPLSPLPPLDEQRFREFLDERIVEALDAIDPALREVLVLSVAGGLRYREVAGVLGCPLGTVMSRMARARRQLRERLAELSGSRRINR